MFFPVSERRTCVFQQVHSVKRGFLRRGNYRLLKYIKWGGGESWPELLRG